MKFYLDEMVIAKECYRRKVNQSKTKGIIFSLSLNEYCNIIHESGIIPSKIGRNKNQYVLGRKCEVTGKIDGDLPYSVGTCRFITTTENLKEFKMDEEQLSKLSIRSSGANNSQYGITGKDRPNFSGYFVTPNGTFENLRDAALENNISIMTCQRRCKGGNNKPFKKCFNNVVTKNMLGKTPKELGYSFSKTGEK